MSLTNRLRPDNLLIISLWLAVLLKPVWAGESESKTQDVAPNPHRDSGLCSLCHTSAAGGRETLRFGGSVSQLCQSCHDGRRAIREAHVVDITPSPTLARKIPSDFPLAGGALTCLSCHDVAQNCREPGAADHPAKPCCVAAGPPIPCCSVSGAMHRRTIAPSTPTISSRPASPRRIRVSGATSMSRPWMSQPREGASYGLRAKSAAPVPELSRRGTEPSRRFAHVRDPFGRDGAVHVGV